MNRRELLKGCTDFMRSMSQGEEGLNYSFAQNGSDDMLVVVFLRGGYDGLNLLAPVDDKHYIAARGEDVRITDSGRNEGLAIDQKLLDADFRLHKNAKMMKELYDDKKLAFVHASGLTNGTRSHFVAQELIEKGTLKEKNLKSGWLARYLKEQEESQLASYAIGNNQPESLLSANKVLSLTRIEDLKINWSKEVQSLMNENYQGSSLIHEQGMDAMNVQRFLDQKSSTINLHKENMKKKGKKKRGGSKVANDLATLENLIKMDVGLKIATVNVGGWDTHDGQEGRYGANMMQLSNALGGFYNRMSKYHKRLNVVVMSEFGRRVKGNNNGGTDHGYGNVMWVLGGNVNGGDVYGKWPGLANDQLDNGVDLAITTDYRTVLGEIMTKRLNQKDLGTVFPKFNYKKGLGIVS